MLQASYAYQLPFSDMAQRFGANSALGFEALFKTKSNWLFGANYAYIFGNKVLENKLLQNLVNQQHYIIDGGGLESQIQITERGYGLFANVGKVISFKKPNPNSGLLVTLGLGYLQHKILIIDVNSQTPQIAGDYIKGYDRLSAGPALRQFVGYQYLGNRKLINFYAGLEFIEGFTKSKRAYNFDTRMIDNKQRQDILIGFKIGWIIPLYKKSPQEFYYN